jgi:pimeloyl-ACP methyl ester carboxylesterase
LDGKVRIIGINGVWCDRNPVWNNLEAAFRSRFHVSDFVIEEEMNCHPWQVARLRRFADRILERYDDGDETLLIGHSMGGVTACAIASRFRKSRVRGVVSIFAPHRFLGGVFARSLKVPREMRVPVITFEAQRDRLVWWGAKHPQSLVHTVLATNHLDDLIDDHRHAEKIAEETRRALFAKV